MIFLSYRGKYALCDQRRSDILPEDDVDLGVTHGDENFLLFYFGNRTDLPEEVIN